MAVFNEAGVTGTIRFVPMNNGDMQVMTSLNGLTGDQTWHVHMFPVDLAQSQSPRCNNDNVGGHYDPLGAVASLGGLYSTYCGMNNQTACEIGDLAGKLGNIPTNGQLSGTERTGMLSLFGRYGTKLSGCSRYITTVMRRKRREEEEREEEGEYNPIPIVKDT